MFPAVNLPVKSQGLSRFQRFHTPEERCAYAATIMMTIRPKEEDCDSRYEEGRGVWDYLSPGITLRSKRHRLAVDQGGAIMTMSRNIREIP
jgi:hypothetical protein